MWCDVNERAWKRPSSLIFRSGMNPKRRNLRPQLWHRIQTMNRESGKKSRALLRLLFLMFSE